MTIAQARNKAVNAARIGEFEPLAKMVDSLRAGLNGVKFDYRGMISFFSRSGVDAEEFEGWMQELEAKGLVAVSIRDVKNSLQVIK